MKQLITTITMVCITTMVSYAQCNTLFSYAAYFNTVNFVNQSTVSNAHYFWNFGDGTGCNYFNPVHIYPDNGEYLTTLFAQDTISKCSSYYEYWVNVTKYSNEPCQPGIADSISDAVGRPILYIYNTSLNCNSYKINVSGGNSAGFPSGHPMLLFTSSFHAVCMGQYFDSTGIKRLAFKTAYSNYSSGHNYGDCSANFEFTVVSRNSLGERILFKAMNKSATFYQWFLSGFGNPIVSNNDTISQFYPFNFPIWIVTLVTQGSSGCRDTISQNIIMEDSTETTLGINEVKDKIGGEIKVYPNPSNGVFTLQSSVISGHPDNYRELVEVYNMLGEKVYSNSYKPTANSYRLSLSNKPNGIYLYRVITEDGNLVGEGKLVIEK